MAITCSEPTDANGDLRGAASQATSRAAKSVKFASLQPARSFTYLALNSSLFAVELWSRLAANVSVRFLEQEAEVSELLAEMLNDRLVKLRPLRAGQSTAVPKIGEGVIAAGIDAAGEVVNVGGDAANGLVAAGIDATKEVVDAGIDAAGEVVNAGSDAQTDS